MSNVTTHAVAQAATTESRALRWWRKRWPRIRYLMWNSPRLLWYEVRYRVWPPSQWQVVRTGLKPGYYDPDTVMMHAMMVCLGRYIKASGGLDGLAQFSHDLREDWRAWGENEGSQEACERQAAIQDEAAAIWRWWTVERPRERGIHEATCMLLFGDGMERGPTWEQETRDHHKEEDRLNAKDQEMLHRLVEIRECLWT